MPEAGKARMRTGVWFALMLFVFGSPQASRAQPADVIALNMEETVERALNNSYRVRQLGMSIDRTRSWLRAERASLKSRVYMNLTAPEFDAISNNKWNSDLQRYEIVRENNRLWQMNFTVQQPVVLFGYPTNGYLSLNNRVYRYTQLHGGRDVRYYNRYFVKYEQPFFQPNHLKNNIEEAELDMEDTELEYREDIVDIIDDVADDYYDLFEVAYERVIFENQVENYERAATLVRELAGADTTETLELNQILVELANARERLARAESSYRLESSRLHQRLRLDPDVSILIDPVIEVVPIVVDVDQAVEFGYTLRPQIQRLEIRKRRDEIDVVQAKGWNSFRVNLEATYGREMQEPRFESLWERPTNSYTVGLHAYVPIWDWGRREARIQAQQISLEKTELYIEETEAELRSDIANAVQNLQEYQQRAMSMQENLEMARQIAERSLERYRDGRISVLDLLQSFRRQEDTAQNFLRAYLGYRQALLSLQRETHYDFEQDLPLFERFEALGARGV